jgi:Family of unknown function (DUF6152)
MRGKLIAFLISLALSAALPLLAHHSFSAEFDGSKAITLDGVVTKIDWANPHVYFFVDVKDSKGVVSNWAVETTGPNGLIRQGWHRNSLKPGDHVIVSAYVARDRSKTANAREITFPDGRKVFTGSPDDGGPKK